MSGQDILPTFAEVPEGGLSPIDEYLRQRYPLLEALDLKINQFLEDKPYVKLILSPTSPSFAPYELTITDNPDFDWESFSRNPYGHDFITRFTDRNRDDFHNLVYWSAKDKGMISPAVKALGADIVEMQGFLVGVFGTDIEAVGPVIHLIHDATDVDNSSAFPVSNVVEAYRYSENAANVLELYQNAQIDEPYEVAFSEVHPSKLLRGLTRLVERYWPEPELIYAKPEKEWAEWRYPKQFPRLEKPDL